MAEGIEKKAKAPAAAKNTAPKAETAPKAATKPAAKTPVPQKAADPSTKGAKPSPAGSKAAAKPAAKAATPKKASGATVPVFSTNGEKKGSIALPSAFSTVLRKDLVHRAVVASAANKRQPYSPCPVAGMQHSVEWPGKGRGMARTPRTNHGSGTGAEAPNTVGGSRAHPPRIDRDYTLKVNRKEKHLARNSAIAATADPNMVSSRGHRFAKGTILPVVVEDSVEGISNTSEAIAFLESVGLDEDLMRSKDGKHIRSGRGKMRGRKYRQPRSVLIVLAPKEGARISELARGFRNLPGVEVVSLLSLGTHHLAPGGDAGRLTVYTKRAVEAMREW